MKKISIVGVLLAVGLGSVNAHADPIPQVPGVRESLVLVVADVTTAQAARTQQATLGRRLGALDGFRVDASEFYDLRAALVQTAPRAISVECPSVDAPFTTRVRSRRVTLECADGFDSVLVNQDVSLRYVPRDAFASHAFPTRCGTATTTPCERETYHRLFGRDLRLPPGRSIVATGFRTRTGAEEFLSFARAIGVHGLVAVQAYKLGGNDIGLGQEPHPDGSGPLLGPLPDQERYQR